MRYKEQREQVLETVHLAYQADLIRMSAGNISLRTEDDMVVITPSGIKYRNMTVKDISVVDLEGEPIDGPPPSSETPMHTAIYRHISRAKGICHTHSRYGMIQAHLQEDVPLTNIELMMSGAPIPVAPWAAPGTEKAGEVTVDIFQSRPELHVILLRQHGLVALGGSLAQAYEHAYNAEVGLETHYKVRLVQAPQSFTEAQIQEIKDVYGL